MAKNAPGKHFRKGMTLIEVVESFSDNATAEKWFIAYFGEVDHRFRGCGSAISVKWIGSSERSNVVGPFPPSVPYFVLLEYQRPSCLSVPGLSGRIAWGRARSRRQGRQPREAGAERSDAP